MRHPISSSPPPAANNSTNPTKTTACCEKVGLKRGPWTPEEDEILSAYIKGEGEGRWRTLPKRAGLARCGKSCRLRWMNYLRPSVKRGHIGPDEEDLILRLHRLLGNRWSLIAGRIPGRTDNEIKNYWNTHLSKKLISQGIDPRTHKPLDPIDSPSNNKPSTSKPDQSKNPNYKFVDPPTSNDPINSQFNDDCGMYYHERENRNLYQALHMQSSDVIRDKENDDDSDINYCTDDVFSSFLNSLVNEDVFNNDHNQILGQHMINGHNVAPPHVSGSNTFITLPQTGFAFSSGWEAPIVSAFDKNHEANRLSDDQVEKH